MLHVDVVASLLDELVPPADDTWHAAPVEGASHILVGRGPRGVVGILFELDGLTHNGRPTKLRHVRFVPAFTAVVRQQQSEREGTFSALWCEDADSTLTEYFLRVVCSLVLTEPVLSGAESPTTAIEAVLELFAAMGNPPKRSVQGLWGELLLVARALDPGAALTAWHTDPNELFDFVGDGVAVEVKTSTTGLREHVFKLDQLLAPDGTAVYVASLLLDERSDGQTLVELVAAIGVRLGGNTDLHRRLESVVAGTLGTAWRDATSRPFALVDGNAALATYQAENIPRVSAAVPPEVSAVTFRSDVSNVERASPFWTSTCLQLLQNLVHWTTDA